jgi:hypothetical protein
MTAPKLALARTTCSISCIVGRLRRFYNMILAIPFAPRLESHDARPFCEYFVSSSSLSMRFRVISPANPVIAVTIPMKIGTRLVLSKQRFSTASQPVWYCVTFAMAPLMFLQLIDFTLDPPRVGAAPMRGASCLLPVSRYRTKRHCHVAGEWAGCNKVRGQALSAQRPQVESQRGPAAAPR